MSDGEKRSIPRQLVDLAWPIVGINVMAVLTLGVDTAMCGRLPDSEVVLTALGFATQVIFLLMVAMMGLVVGTVSLVSRAFGGGDSARVNHVLLQSTMLTASLSVAVAVVGNLVAGPMLAAMGASPPVEAVALQYLRPLLTTTLFYYMNILLAGVLRGVGNTRLPLRVAVLQNVLNIFLNYLLILGNLGFPALGIRGAAYGTIISHASGMVLMIVLLRQGIVAKLTFPLTLRRFDWPVIRELVRVGTPAALDMVILNASLLSIVGMLGRLDEVSVAAHGIGLRIQALAFVPGMSISQATGAMVGQSLGADDVPRAKSVVRAAVVLCTVVMSTLAIAFVVFAQPLVGIFDVPVGSKLEWFSVLWIELLGYGMPVVGTYIALVGMLQGAGETNTSLRINIISTVAFQIPLSALLGMVLGYGAWGVWVAFPISFVLKAVMAWVVYRRGRWAKTGMRVSPT